MLAMPRRSLKAKAGGLPVSLFHSSDLLDSWFSFMNLYSVSSSDTLRPVTYAERTVTLPMVTIIFSVIISSD